MCAYNYMHISFTRLQDSFHTTDDYLPHRADSQASTLHAILLPPSPIDSQKLTPMRQLFPIGSLMWTCLDGWNTASSYLQAETRAMFVYVCLPPINVSLYAMPLGFTHVSSRLLDPQVRKHIGNGRCGSIWFVFIWPTKFSWF